MSDAAQQHILQVLLVVSLFTSILCATVAMLMVGAKLILRQYQKTVGINGSNTIQSTINIRTYSMRVFVGVTFGIFAALLWADAPMIWRQWINRTLFILVPLGYFVATLLDWFAERRQMELEVKQDAENRLAARVKATQEEHDRTASLQAAHDSWRAMAAESTAALDAVADRTLEARGTMRPTPVAAVVPEHNSPVTPDQQATADIQTLRAKLTASKLALGLPARDAIESSEAPRSVLGQSLGDMAAAAGETLQAAEKTVVAAETAVEAINDDRAQAARKEHEG